MIIRDELVDTTIKIFVIFFCKLLNLGTICMKPVLCRDFYIWSLIYHFVRAQSVLQIGENQKSVLFFYPKLWNFEYSKASSP